MTGGVRQRSAAPAGVAEPAHLPPQNLEAETSVLGSLMVAPNLIAGVTEVLRPKHFYRLSQDRKSVV